MIELLFENLKETKNQFEENINKFQKNPNIYRGRLSYTNVLNQDLLNFKNKKKSKVSVDNVMFNKNDNFPSFTKNKIRNRNLSISNINKNFKSVNKLFSNRKSYLHDISNQHLILLNESYKKKDLNPEEKTKNKNMKNYASDKYIIKNKNNVIKGKLFPYKYYLYSVFIKNLDISKNNLFISSRFAKVYTFLCQLFDVTTYLRLQREFNVLKNSLSENKKKLIENHHKINVNSKNFLKDISDCIGEQKLHIF